MISADEILNPHGGVRAKQMPHDQLAGVLAVPGETTVVFQHTTIAVGLFRYFTVYCMAGGKFLLPFGRGAGAPILYCHEESETRRIEMRQELVSNRDPYETSRERAKVNIRHYCLRRKDRTELSLLTREGQRALWSELEPARVVAIDSLEGFTKVAGKDAATVSASAPLGELLERLTSRGIAVVIFAKAQGRRKEPPAWLDGLTCNMVYVEEDHKNPLQGGARLTFYRDAINDRDRALRRFTWWWKVDNDGKLEFSCREEHFAEPLSPKQQAQEERFEAIKALIAEGISQQKEIAERLGVHPSTIFHATEELVRRGEIIKDLKTGSLSLPCPEASPAEGTDDPGNDGHESGEEW
ncbi:helix-turn-helix domain protein [Burkholderia pseudomallei MSHR2138]|nr:helix-turn-helix domain protein [Burkholderia pseudomallei MSHR2138]